RRRLGRVAARGRPGPHVGRLLRLRARRDRPRGGDARPGALDLGCRRARADHCRSGRRLHRLGGLARPPGDERRRDERGARGARPIDPAGRPMIIEGPEQLDAIDFAKANGIVPVIAQHAHTGEVLMLAFADREALARTLDERVMWYRSRSRNALWRKGDTSGNVQHRVALHADCDRDTILARVLPAGPACHTGAANCFDTAPALSRLDAVIADRAQAPGPGYTRQLLADRNLRLKKLGEEATELALACADGDPE